MNLASLPPAGPHHMCHTTCRIDAEELLVEKVLQWPTDKNVRKAKAIGAGASWKGKERKKNKIKIIYDSVRIAKYDTRNTWMLDFKVSAVLDIVHPRRKLANYFLANRHVVFDLSTQCIIIHHPPYTTSLLELTRT